MSTRNSVQRTQGWRSSVSLVAIALASAAALSCAGDWQGEGGLEAGQPEFEAVDSVGERLAACTPVTYEAENMAHPVGVATPGGWNLTTNGYISTTHTFSGSLTRLSVVAAGQLAGNQWPNMRVTVAGTQVFSGSVNTSSWKAYSFNVSPSAGSKEVRIHFTNDFYQPPADRNLLVDKLNLSCPAVCGNGVLESGEECDDGNSVNTDACTNVCRAARCGDGWAQSGEEECDDGNSDNNDACTNVCLMAACGDGVLHRDLEECDDGNSVNTDACTNQCLAPVCGDGIRYAGVEECDDGNSNNSDSCISTCLYNRCGDSFRYTSVTLPRNPNPLEQCDDGNLASGDSCSPSCRLP